MIWLCHQRRCKCVEKTWVFLHFPLHTSYAFYFQSMRDLFGLNLYWNFFLGANRFGMFIFFWVTRTTYRQLLFIFPFNIYELRAKGRDSETERVRTRMNNHGSMRCNLIRTLYIRTTHTHSWGTWTSHSSMHVHT